MFESHFYFLYLNLCMASRFRRLRINKVCKGRLAPNQLKSTTNLPDKLYQKKVALQKLIYESTDHI